MAKVNKLVFANGCGAFQAELPRTAIILSVDCGCMNVLVNGTEEDKENSVIRTFCSVQTGQPINFGPDGTWNLTYIGSWRDYHVFEGVCVESANEDEVEEAPAIIEEGNTDGEQFVLFPFFVYYCFVF